jgi:hypothetical protein
VEASHARQFAARLRQVSIHPGQKSTGQ